MFFFLTIVGLSLLILVHELGHFVAAKLFGLRVDEFGFGLPPRALGKRIGETIYSLNWLPFGGFVKIYGEDSPENYPNTTKGHKMEEKKAAAVSDEFVDLDRDRSFVSQKPWKKSIIILSGVLMNFILGWFLISAVFMIGAPKGIFITEVAKDGPGAISGIVLGDRVLGYGSAEEFIDFIKKHRGEEIVLDIERGGEIFKIQAIPRINPPLGEGALGISLAEGGERLGFLPALSEGLFTTIKLIGFIFVALFTLIFGVFTGGADLTGISGPIGIFGVARGAGALGLAAFLNLFALISINLGVLNAIPFPALDGGRFLFIVIEKIKGAPLPVKFERLANGIGFAILISLMILITIRDVQNIVM